MARVFENHIESHEVKKKGEETRGPNGWSTYGRLCVLGEGSSMRSLRKEAKKGRPLKVPDSFCAPVHLLLSDRNQQVTKDPNRPAQAYLSSLLAPASESNVNMP